VKQECCKLAFCVRWATVLLRYEPAETLHMTGSNCGQRIKLSFIGLNSSIDDYHTGVVQFQYTVSPLVTDWTSFLWKKAPTFNSWLRYTPFSKFFSKVHANSILSLNQMLITSISKFYTAICKIKIFFSQFRRLVNISNQDRHKNDLQDTSFCCLVYWTTDLRLVSLA